MSSIQLTGTLDLPLTQDSTGTKVRFTCMQGKDTLLKTAPQIMTTSTSDGSYDVQLLLGMHYIEVLYDGQWNFLGNVQVDAQTPSPITLNTLIDNHSVPIPGSTAELPSYKSMNLKGEWDASSGNFPPDPIYPNQLSDVWTVSTGGTMTGPQPSMTVIANDMLYWNITDQAWSLFRSAPLPGEDEVLTGTQNGDVTVVAFASLFAGMIQMYNLDGSQMSTTITHNKNRKVVPMFFNSSNRLEYPIYDQPDGNTLVVTAGENLLGTLIVI